MIGEVKRRLEDNAAWMRTKYAEIRRPKGPEARNNWARRRKRRPADIRVGGDPECAIAEQYPIYWAALLDAVRLVYARRSYR